MNAPAAFGRSPSALWRAMQRIEACRHTADLLEQAALHGDQRHRAELLAMAKHWRACAAHIYLLHATDETVARLTP